MPAIYALLTQFYFEYEQANAKKPMTYASRRLRRTRRRIQDIPPVSQEYHRARKQLVLWSALLFAWEFIGIEIKDNLFPNLNVHIKSPGAAPYVLLCLVLYFGYRIVMEWLHMPPERRNVRITRRDFKVSIAIPIIALLVFGIQQVLKTQIYTIISEDALIIFVGVVIAFLIGTSSSHHTRMKTRLKIHVFIFVLITIVVMFSNYTAPTNTQWILRLPEFLRGRFAVLVIILLSVFGFSYLKWQLEEWWYRSSHPDLTKYDVIVKKTRFGTLVQYTKKPTRDTKSDGGQG